MVQHFKKDCTAHSSSDKSQTKTQGDSKAFFGGIVNSLTKSDAWYVDSGATNHMCKRRDWFETYSKLEKPIEVLLGNGEMMQAIGRGDIKILSHDGEQWIEKTIKNVLHAPDLYAN